MKVNPRWNLILTFQFPEELREKASSSLAEGS
jgi:hypothetical protein